MRSKRCTVNVAAIRGDYAECGARKPCHRHPPEVIEMSIGAFMEFGEDTGRLAGKSRGAASASEPPAVADALAARPTTTDSPEPARTDGYCCDQCRREERE